MSRIRNILSLNIHFVFKIIIIIYLLFIYVFRQDDGGRPEIDKVRGRGHRDAGAHQGAVRGVVPGVPAARPLRRARHAPDRGRRRHQGTLHSCSTLPIYLITIISSPTAGHKSLSSDLYELSVVTICNSAMLSDV